MVNGLYLFSALLITLTTICALQVANLQSHLQTQVAVATLARYHLKEREPFTHSYMVWDSVGFSRSQRPVGCRRWGMNVQLYNHRTTVLPPEPQLVQHLPVNRLTESVTIVTLPL